MTDTTVCRWKNKAESVLQAFLSNGWPSCAGEASPVTAVVLTHGTGESRGDSQPRGPQPRGGDSQPRGPQPRWGDSQPRGPQPRGGDSQPRGPQPRGGIPRFSRYLCILQSPRLLPGHWTHSHGQTDRASSTRVRTPVRVRNPCPRAARGPCIGYGDQEERTKSRQALF